MRLSYFLIGVIAVAVLIAVLTFAVPDKYAAARIVLIIAAMYAVTRLLVKYAKLIVRVPKASPRARYLVAVSGLLLWGFSFAQLLLFPGLAPHAGALLAAVWMITFVAEQLTGVALVVWAIFQPLCLPRADIAS